MIPRYLNLVRSSLFSRLQRFSPLQSNSIQPPLPFQLRSKSTFSSRPISPSGTGGFELTFLGTSSQGGARRYPSSLAVRLRGSASSEVWLFDAGEGAMAQLQRSSMRVGLVRNIFVTHLHGDHLYGLPGLVMSILGRREIPNKRDDATLNVYGPQGIRGFLRMSLGVAGFKIPGKNALRINELIWPEDFGTSSVQARHRCISIYWKCSVKRLSFEMAGKDLRSVKDVEGRHTYSVIESEKSDEETCKKNLRWAGRVPATVLAAPILHTVPTYAFNVTESVVATRFNKTKLVQLGIPPEGCEEVKTLFERWSAGLAAVWRGKKIGVEEVILRGRAPRRLCVVGDTYDASGAAHIAEGADVLIHESTNMAAATSTARSRGHSSTVGASAFAKRVGAKRLILNHASVSYSERKIRAMELEARGMFGAGRAYVARDLSAFSIPTREEDRDGFIFRRFVGFSDSLEFKQLQVNPFSCDFDVDGSENTANEDREYEDLEPEDISATRDCDEGTIQELTEARNRFIIRSETDIHDAAFRKQKARKILAA